MRNFLRNNLLILVILNSSNVFNYLFQLIVGRTLTPADYGSFNALNSLAVVLSAPVAVLPLVFSRYTVQLSVSGLPQVKSLLVDGFRRMVLVAAGILIIGLLALPWLKSYLHLDSTPPLMIMLAQLVLSLLLPVLLGVIQGLHRFVHFGFASSSVALVRFLGALSLVMALGWGVNGALLSGTLGTLMAMGIAFWTLNDILKTPRSALPHGIFHKMGRYSLPVFLSTTMVMTLGNLDIVLVRHYCLPEEAGLYSIAAILGRIAMFLPGVLIIVLFPEAVKTQAAGQEDVRLLWVSLGLTALLGGGIALACSLWPRPIIALLFGEKYIGAAVLLQIVSAAMAMLAVANVIFTYCLARSEFTFLWPLAGGVGLMLILIFYFHDTARTIAEMVLISVGVILTGTMGWYLLRVRRPLTSP
ncbi:MAG: polysaccharide biosynthesis protein [Nitrospinaceae bacterium]